MTQEQQAKVAAEVAIRMRDVRIRLAQIKR